MVCLSGLGSDWLIEARSLTKNYGQHVALDKVDLHVPHGSIGLLGPNGAGKSTLIKTLLGLIHITSGEGKVLGHDIRTEGDLIRSKIGYMAEYDSLNLDLAAIDQVRYSAELLGMSPTVLNSVLMRCLSMWGFATSATEKSVRFQQGWHSPRNLVVLSFTTLNC